MKKPNIVFILNDHQIHYRHGWDGGQKPITKNFDALAAEGVTFDNAYCATPLCGPVRRTMLNGLYAHKHGQHYNDSAVPYDEESYLRLLSGAGYNNYYFGKWHAGPGTPQEDHNCGGFSCEHYGNPYITDTYKEYLEKRGLETAVHKIEYDFSPSSHHMFFDGLEEGTEYRCKDTWCGEHAVGVTITPKETHEAFFLANLACDQLEQLANSEDNEPFHLRVDFWGPHQPFFPTQEYIDMYDPEKIEVYGNLYDDLENRAQVHKTDVNKNISKDKQIILPSALPWKEWQTILARAYAHQTMVDDAGGLILKKLEELGLSEDTLVIWSTDHGDALASHGGHFDKCSYMSEEVMRIPMAMRWPKVLNKKEKSSELVSNIDIPVTILDAAGLKFSEKVHGQSILSGLLSKEHTWRKGLMCETAGHGYSERVHGRMYVEGDFKYVNFVGQLEELYNLKDDPYELNNLAYDKNHLDKRQYMFDALRKIQSETEDRVEISTQCVHVTEEKTM